MHPHRSSALDGAAAALTVARTRGVAMPLSWSWSRQPQGRACAAAPALRDTFIRTPYGFLTMVLTRGLARAAPHVRGFYFYRGFCIRVKP